MGKGFGSGGGRLLITVRWRPERCAFKALLAQAEPDESRQGMPTTYADKVGPRVCRQPMPTRVCRQPMPTSVDSTLPRQADINGHAAINKYIYIYIYM